MFERVLKWVAHIALLGRPGALLGDLPDLLLLSLVAQALPDYRVEILDGRSVLSEEQIARALERCQQEPSMLLLRLTPQSGNTIFKWLPDLLGEGRLPSGQMLSKAFRCLIHAPLGDFPGSHMAPLKLCVQAVGNEYN
ncbi:hypothetical protein JST97_11565 [bacterium]|nr:hypothetical protein [bacterium]